MPICISCNLQILAPNNNALLGRYRFPGESFPRYKFREMHGIFVNFGENFPSFNLIQFTYAFFILILTLNLFVSIEHSGKCIQNSNEEFTLIGTFLLQILIEAVFLFMLYQIILKILENHRKKPKFMTIVFSRNILCWRDIFFPKHFLLKRYLSKINQESM